MPGSFRIARIAGIDIYVHFSWLLIFMLITFSLASEVLPTSWSEPKQLFVAAIAALLFFTSVVAHELAHSIVAQRFGMSVSSITLFLLGGVANLKQEPPSARVEFLMAIAGPFTSFAIAGIVYLVQLAGNAVLDAAAMTTIAPVTGYLTTVNIVVGIFNLVPGFPLDGGRVLRSIVWALRGDRVRATAIAARGGQIVAVGIGLLGGFFIVIGDTGGLWYLVIAYFLYEMAGTSLAQERLLSTAAGVRVSDLMVTGMPIATPGTTIDVIVREAFLPLNLRSVPVLDGGRLVGIVAIGDLRAIGQERWREVTVDEIMTPARDLAAVSPGTPLVKAIESFDGASLLPVVSNGAFVGVLYPEAVVAFLRTREALGLPRASAHSA